MALLTERFNDESDILATLLNESITQFTTGLAEERRLNPREGALHRQGNRHFSRDAKKLIKFLIKYKSAPYNRLDSSIIKEIKKYGPDAVSEVLAMDDRTRFSNQIQRCLSILDETYLNKS